MKKATITGTILATTVALILANAPARAADDGSSSSAPAQVKCLGGNSCKGQSSCQTANNSCAGQNSCKGKGWVMKSNTKACDAAGGKVAKD
jgi:hypothetical protein